MRRPHKTRYASLAIATALLAANFWAWSLLSPLANDYARTFALTPFAVSALLAVPVIVGSLGRIPLGLLTDRFGGKRMFAAACFAASITVVGLALAGSYPTLLFAAFCLGIAGAVFAIGVPFVSAWFPKHERGFALGVYAVGNAGTALSGLLTPRMAVWFGHTTVFLFVALLLITAGAAMLVFGADAPEWRPAPTSAAKQFARAFRWRTTWLLSALYAITFGAFVAFGFYLPVMLHVVYGLSATDAAARAAGFVLVATATRPLGGWLSDRVGGIAVIRTVFLAVAVLAPAIALEPSLAVIGTIAYLSLAAGLGVGNGAIFALIGHQCDERIVGTVTGIVGAAGGLGGFFPPLVMGVSFQLLGSYAAALLLLGIVCALILFSTFNYRFTLATRQH